jgi:phage-related holin
MNGSDVYFINKIVALFEPSSLKVVASAFLSVIFFFFGELYTQALIAVVMLMVLDAVLGVWASKQEGLAISSERFADSVKKGIVYFLSISAGYFVDLTIPFDAVQATMVGFVGVTEFISVLENVGRMGYQTPKKLLNQLKDFQKHQ